LWTVVRGVWIAAMVAAPLFGFWLASSLAAYNNASQWLALVVGLALFPIVPVAWEAFASWRRSKRSGPPPILTLLDRLSLRTLAFNAVFLGGMLEFARHTALRAVALRGDWMFDGYEGGAADALRGGLLALADHLESHSHEQQFGTSDKPPPEPEHVDHPQPPRGNWPNDDAPSVFVTEMPESVQGSIEMVGAYLKDHVPDPRQRVKAIHDYVVLRLTYDEATLKRLMADRTADEPSQQAQDVFARKTAVCEGYARLMVALGQAADVEIAYVTGSIRDAQRRVAEGDDATVKAALDGYAHAWNAVKLDGHWELVDATWDDPTGGGPTLRSTYLFTPPELFLLNHLPDDPAWQLVATPMTAGEFVRQPMMSPDVGRFGLALRDPTRAQVSVDGSIAITLDNPQHAELMAEARADGSTGEGKPCLAGDTKITCSLGRGEYDIELFAGHKGDARLEYIGTVLANSR
jgi:hypothetical protein